MFNHHLVLPVAIAAAFSQAASAQQASRESHISYPSSAAEASDRQIVATPVGLGKSRVMSGTVNFIDIIKRRVVVKEADGRASMINMSPGVKDFENLRRGDKLTISSSEGLALSILNRDEGDTGKIRQLVEANAVRQEPAGGKPGLVRIERSTLVANVYQNHQASGTVTLRDTDGAPVKWEIGDALALQGIGLNDQVVVSYVKATSLAVQRESLP